MGLKKVYLLLDSRLEELDRLALAIDDFCAEAGVPGAAPDFLLCAEELFTNIVLHGLGGEAGHRIDVEIAQGEDRIDVAITDDAPPFDPTTPIAPDLDAPVEARAIGGLGRHLVSTIMDSFCYRRERNRNCISFGRRVAENEGQ
ncbi:MAG: ATP-binding protein [Pseudomonadota bacterium]